MQNVEIRRMLDAVKSTSQFTNYNRLFVRKADFKTTFGLYLYPSQ